MGSLAQAQADGVVIGLKGLSGIHPRREIDDLVVNEPDMFNLFILALESLQKDEGAHQNKMGYFQIAGIHGLPKRDWDGVQGEKPGQGGYCTHNSILFPTWHRPYLAIQTPSNNPKNKQQTIYATMEHIASQFTDPKYRDAARRFRLPYWDYLHARAARTTTFPGVFAGRKTSFGYDFGLPLALREAKLMVHRPAGVDAASEARLVAIDNPLRSFAFPQTNGVAADEWQVLEQQVQAEGGGFYLSQRRTARHPRSGPTGGDDDFADLDAALNKDREPEVQTLLDLIELAPYADFGNFATAVPSGKGGAGAPNGSLESFHGAYHVLIGGAGHMSRVPIAAFDPIFWFHHCNIDRILAVWQSLHDDFTPSSGTPNASSNLYPFRKDSSGSSFWTSTDSRDVTTFGYTYADIAGATDRQAVLARFDACYRWSLQRQSRQGGAQNPAPPAEMQPVDVRGAQCFRYTAAATVGAAVQAPMQALSLVQQKVLEVKDQAVNAISGAARPAAAATASAGQEAGTEGGAVQVQPSFRRGDEILAEEPAGSRLVLQWYIDSEVNKDALDGAFTLYFFIGPTAAADTSEAGDGPATWQAEPTLAGMTHVFAAPRAACDNCALQSDEGLRVTGTTAVTPILLDYVEDGRAGLGSLAPDDVVPFLRRALVWRVADVNQRVTNPAELAGGLTISVSATISVLRPDQPIPEFREPLFFPEVMDGRPATGDPVAA
ncbi:tyrosinase [Diplodia corticola]|uniref:tyrosinase n=1 Tax=Diplodia corticola TaxID=236234 RepID=A0A1J9RHE1_9PEZI|nr:tyrosinase [Diplodia corticola]OJD40032.1 tyrosinase [Diplodia corticola]